MASTMANDRTRFLINPHTPWPGFGSTSQMVFKASCIWMNTPVAPKRIATTARTVARTPPSLFSAPSTSIARPSSPRSPRPVSWLICDRTVSAIEQQSGDGQHNDQHGSERKHRVIGQCGAQPGALSSDQSS